MNAVNCSRVVDKRLSSPVSIALIDILVDSSLKTYIFKCLKFINDQPDVLIMIILFVWSTNSEYLLK